jgi:hypothetical protein
MKKTTAIFVALSLALGSIGTAQADWGRHEGYRPDYRDRYEHHEHHRGGGWVGPAALLAITGLAIGAAAYSQAAPAVAYSAPVYSPPPRPVQVMPESGSWYYCESSGQYYPYTRACPEGWQAVMPPR